LIPAQLSLSVGLVNFGSVTVGTSQSSTVVVRNNGEAPTSFITVSAIPVPAFTIGMNSCGAPLTAGGTCTVEIVFSPGSTAGSFTGSFVATATTGGMASIPVTGMGVTPGALLFSPSVRTFDATVIMQVGQTLDLTLANTGGGPLPAPEFAIGGSAAMSFIVESTTCPTAPTMLAATASCIVRIRFAPQVAGPLSAFISATSGSNTVQATLTGTGQAPAQLRLSPPSAAFAETIVGQTTEQIFTVTNSGDVPSGAVSLSTGGTHASQWSVQGSTCTLAALPPRGTCTFRLVYAPTASATLHSASVTASAGPGGMATASVAGSAITPALLTLAPAAGSSTNYGNVLVGSPAVDRTFVLTNTGQQASGTLSGNFSGPNASQWQLVSGTNACQLGQTLNGGQSCTIYARFTATLAQGSGTKTATMTATAMPGGSPSLTLTANVQAPALLQATDSTRNFGDVIATMSSPAFSWVIRNAGDVQTGTLSFMLPNGSGFTVLSNGCTGTLAPMATCTISIAFTPFNGLPASSLATVSAAPGGSVSLALSGNGQWLVSVTAPTNPGTRVQTSDGRITCPGTCSAGYGEGASVTFQARTTNGSGFHFERWTSPNQCGGLAFGPDCVRTISGAESAAAIFAPIDANLVFVSSTYVPANLGGVAPYDARCNALATAAGINNTTNDAFRAWISTASSPVMQGPNARITTAGGWKRLDRSVFASSKSALTGGQVRVPIEIDEWGRRVTTGLSAWTGTDPTGAPRPSQDCSGWTSSSASVFLDRGRVEGGPDLWTAGTGGHTCANTETRIYCFQNTLNGTAMGPSTPSTAKTAFVSPPWSVSGGVSGADTHCNTNKPMGTTGSFVAFLATTTQSAAARLPVRASYFAPNGTFIGTSDALKATTAAARDANLNAGIWHEDRSVYANGSDTAWTGADCANCTAASGQNCNNWTQTMSGFSPLNTRVGRVTSSGSDFFDGFGATNP
ncbi:MAG: choice-of-anchor D domain-containing protein, partial [Myxococcaceae bacterium]|nr:choice-of-anchor D domain-containing protein [Myxococcaceae bacterium]